MKPQVKPELKQPPKEPEMFIPDKVTRDDFFRLKRVGNCWQVEMLRVSGDKVVFRRDVYAEDLLSNAEAKARNYIIEAERAR